MIECWPGRSLSFMRSGMCAELWSWQGEGERHGVAVGKSACFDIEAVVEIEGVKAGPTRSHIALRNLRVERSKSRTTSGSSDSSIGSSSGSSSDFELALVFEKPGRYTLPLADISRIRCKYLHQGKASIEARDSLFHLTAVSQNELERLLDVIRDVKTVKVLADSRLCTACKDKGERKKKMKLKREQQQQQPTDSVTNSRLDGECQATKRQKVKVLECIFRKKHLPSLVDMGHEQVHDFKDLLRRRDRDHTSHKMNKVGLSPPAGRDARSIEVDEGFCYNVCSFQEGMPLDHKFESRDLNVRSKARDGNVAKISSPSGKVIFPDEFSRRSLADGARRAEAQRIPSERRNADRRTSLRSSEEEKENVGIYVDEDYRKTAAEGVTGFAQGRGPDGVLRKAQAERGRVVEEKRLKDELRALEMEERKRTDEKEKTVRRKESLRKLVEQERKRKEDWEARRVEERKWKEDEDERKQKAEVERLKKSLERRLQEEDRLRKEEKRKEEEKRMEEEKRKISLERRFQEEEGRRKDEEDRRVQKEEEDKRVREAERKLQDLKQREDDEMRAREAERDLHELRRREEEKQMKEVLRKLQEQIQETRKQDEEKVQEAINFFKLEEDLHKLREQEELRKFQESVKITNRLSHRYRRTRVTEEARMSPDEMRKIMEDKLEHMKLDEDMRRWRTEENHRRTKEDSWAMPDFERSLLEEQRKRVEEVMKMSKRLHRKTGESVKEEVEERKNVPEDTQDGKPRWYASAEGERLPDDREDKIRSFLEQLRNGRDPKVRNEEDGLRQRGESFNPTENNSKRDRSKEEEVRKEELERKKAMKAADDQKKKLAQERIKAAKLEAKRLEKVLKEAQKRAKAEERVRQQQKAQEQMRQKAAASASHFRCTIVPGLHHFTYQQYEDAWTMMKMSGKKSLLGYSDISWPPHGNPLFVEAGDSLAAQRRKLRTALLRWHPDKFVSLCGNRLLPSERECIEARAKNLAQEVILWKNKLDSIS